MSPCLSGGRERTTLTRVANDTVTIKNVAEYYGNATCSGAIIGTVAFSEPVTAKYTDTRAAFIFQTSITSGTNVTVDNFAGSFPESYTLVSGSNVETTTTAEGHKQACIKIGYKDSSGKTLPDVCRITDVPVAGGTVQYGFLLNGTTLYLPVANDSQPDSARTYYYFNTLYTKQ